MRLLRRQDSPEAVHARVGDGEHLWLAVRGTTDDLALTRAGAEDLPVPATVEGELLVARFALAAALADVEVPDLELILVAGRGRRTTPVALAEDRPSSPTLPAPPTADGRYLLSVDATEGPVTVRRRAVAPTVAVLALGVDGDDVRVRLDTAAATVDLAGVGPLPLHDGELVVPRDLALPPGPPATLTVAGVPVSRRRNLMARPHYATLLPPLAPPLELRWLPDGRLALARRKEG